MAELKLPLSKSLAKPADIQTITKEMLFHHGEPFATSTQIAKYFGKKHKEVRQKIEAFDSFDQLLRGGKIRPLIRIYRGQEYTYYELDADAYAFTCLSFTGTKAEHFKWAFIQAFKQASIAAIEARVAMETNRANEQWLSTKKHGKGTRLSLTDKIKEFCKYAELQRGGSYNGRCPFYIHITQAVYEFLGVKSPKAGRAARDVYNGAVLEAIEETEQAVIQILNEIMESDGTRKAVKKQIINRLQRSGVGL